MGRVIPLLALALCGCGLESALWNAGHEQYPRPASKITGTVPMGVTLDQITVVDGDGNAIEPFEKSLSGQSYELRLPSAKYSMLRVKVVAGNVELRAIVPFVGEESGVAGVDVDARGVTECLITEARLSGDGTGLKQVTPEAYLGTRKLIRAAFDAAGPTKELLGMVERFFTLYDPALAVTSPNFFNPPKVEKADTSFVVKTSPVDGGFLLRQPFDYVGDKQPRKYTDDFDAKLVEVIKLFRPAGCPDPTRIRTVFTCDFTAAGKNGDCGNTDRFKWATDKPGKAMYFVGWIHKDSAVQDPAVNALIGLGTPNNLPMYDDGTNGDEKAGDGIWSIYFDLPRGEPGKRLRIGYKYTWGTRGAVWTGSEEWPGNSRILEVADDNVPADEFVYRHDVFGDESSNKDNANLNKNSTGSLAWDTDLHKCGTPEAHENRFDNATCSCEMAPRTPKWIGPLTVTCM